MTLQEALPPPATGAEEEDSSKRRQIADGARAVFLAKGFDAASMGEIARAAGVSKGTLYVYFKNKEELFETIVEQECALQAAGVFDFALDDHDVEAVLTRVGNGYSTFLCRPGGVSPIRTVIGIAERMPEIGRKFYESGPADMIAKLSAYIKAQVDAGILTVDDCDVAAAQFLDACQSILFKPLVFNHGDTPSRERIEYVTKIAVRTFLAAYKAR